MKKLCKKNHSSFYESILTVALITPHILSSSCNTIHKNEANEDTLSEYILQEDAYQQQESDTEFVFDLEDQNLTDEITIEWIKFEGEIPEIPTLNKQNHITSCLRTRACFPENPQQISTCTSAYAHITGRETGITLWWVSQCVINAPLECSAIRACLSNGGDPEPCTPLQTPDTCDGSVLKQCSRASGLIFAFDCSKIGMNCFLDNEGTAHCGLGICNPDNFWSTCEDNILIYCDKGVILVADCQAAGLYCTEDNGEPGKCSGNGENCDENTMERLCDSHILKGCIGGRTAEINCGEVIENWTCGETDGTYGCVPSGNECHAYPLIGSDINESCSENCVVTCLDGYIIRLCCEDYGFSTCVDLGTAARCSL